MTKIELPGGTVNTLTYDGDGKCRRFEGSAGLRNLLWDGENLLVETDSGGSTVARSRRRQGARQRGRSSFPEPLPWTLPEFRDIRWSRDGHYLSFTTYEQDLSAVPVQVRESITVLDASTWRVVLHVADAANVFALSDASRRES